jgi:PAS domain S-box-containing protein
MFAHLQRFMSSRAKERDALTNLQASIAAAEKRPLLRRDDITKIEETYRALAVEIESTRETASSVISTLSTELEQSKRRISAIFDSLMSSLISFDSKGKIIEINPAAERVFGYTNEQVVGRSIAELTRDSQCLRYIEQALEEGRRYTSFSRERYSADESYIVYREAYQQYLDTPGVYFNRAHSVTFMTRVGGFVHLNMHLNVLTPDVQNPDDLVFVAMLNPIEETASDTTSKFPLGLLTALASPLFYKDSHSNFMGVNDAFCRMCKVTREEVIGTDGRKLFDESTLAEFSNSKGTFGRSASKA